MCGVNLKKTILSEADFTDGNLLNADLSETEMEHTCFLAQLLQILNSVKQMAIM